MSDPRLGPTSAQITMMGHLIHARIDDGRRRRRRRRLTALVGGLALAVGVAVTAAAIAVRPAPDDQVRYLVDCHPEPALTEEYSRVLYLPDEDSDVPFGSEFALLQCTRIYERMGVDAPNPTVCELSDLRLGVFPNRDELPADEFCLRLGLAAPPS